MIRLCPFFMAFLLASSLCLAEVNQVESPKGSQKIALPQALTDSLPWFAVREANEKALPFTRTHLTGIAKKSNRTALVYFATWCIPCRVGIKQLADNFDELQKNNVSIILVNIGDRDEKLIQKWLKNIGATDFMVINDPFKRLTEGFGLAKEGEEVSLPRTIVIDNNLKPLFMIGEEGSDWPNVIWEK